MKTSQSLLEPDIPCVDVGRLSLSSTTHCRNIRSVLCRV